MSLDLDLDRLAAAKLWLISAPTAGTVGAGTVGARGAGARGAGTPRDLPYLAQALYALVPVRCDEVARMSCDERWRLYVNPAWLAAASVPRIGAELAHLVWHLLHDHATRARDQDVDRATAAAWATATHAALAATLEPDRLRPPWLERPGDLGLPEKWSAEEYFAAISRLPSGDGSVDARDGDGRDGHAHDGDGHDPADGCGSGADGLARGHELGEAADISHVSTHEAGEIRRIVAIEYRDHLLQRGTEPGEALRWVRTTLEPRVPWPELLTGAVRRAVGWAAGRGDFSYRRPSRRTGALPGIVLPGQHRPVPRVSVVVDTSASMDDGLLARALGEVDGAIAALGVPGTSVSVYSVDAAVHTVQRVRRARDARLVGAGGTDLRHGLAAAAQERPRPDVVIVLTDGDTPWPHTPPVGAAVVVGVLGRRRSDLPPTPDWATRVECLLEE